MSGPRVAELLNHLAHRGDVLKSLEEGHSDSRELQIKPINLGLRLIEIFVFKDDGYVKEYVGDYQLTQFGRFALQVYQLAERLAYAEPYWSVSPA